MMKRYRGEIALFLLTIALCLIAVRAFSQDLPKPTNSPRAVAEKLNPGDEVKPTELEAAKLGKLKAQIDRAGVQALLLQQQYTMVQNERSQLQAKIDALVNDIQSRVKLEKSVEIVYDQTAGEDGAFRVNAPPPQPPDKPAPAAKK